MRDSAINPQSAKIFGGMTANQLKESGGALSLTGDDYISLTTMKYGPGNEEQRKALALKLIARKHDVIKKSGIVLEANPSAVAAKKIEPEPPPIGVTPGDKSTSVPSKLTQPAYAKSNETYNKKVKALYELACKGDIEGVKAIKTNQHALNSTGKKPYFYQQQLLKELGAGAVADSTKPTLAGAPTLEQATAKPKKVVEVIDPAEADAKGLPKNLPKSFKLDTSGFDKIKAGYPILTSNTTIKALNEGKIDKIVQYAARDTPTSRRSRPSSRKRATRSTRTRWRWSTKSKARSPRQSRR